MHQKKSKKVLIYIFLFLIIGTLNNRNLGNMVFMDIIKVAVKGLDEKNNQELKDSLSLLKIDNLFFLNEISIKEILNSNSLVEK